MRRSRRQAEREPAREILSDPEACRRGVEGSPGFFGATAGAVTGIAFPSASVAKRLDSVRSNVQPTTLRENPGVTQAATDDCGINSCAMEHRYEDQGLLLFNRFLQPRPDRR